MLKIVLFTIIGAGALLTPALSAAARCDIDLEIANDFDRDISLRSIRHGLVGKESTFGEETILDASMAAGAVYRVLYTDTGGEKCGKSRRLKLQWTYLEDGEEKIRNVITQVFGGGGTSMGVRITIDADGRAQLEVSSY